MKRRPDPYLRTQPWKVAGVFDPLERFLHRLEMDGTVDVAGRQVVFREDGAGGWYDLIAALLGVVEFHQIEESRFGLPCDVSGLARLAKKLDAAAPVFETDVISARRAISECERQAMRLRVSEAASIVDTVRISMEMDRLRDAAVAI